jgi:methionyl-tRNA formyltransferase
VAAGEGALLVREVQPPGKGRMDAQSFVNGGGVQIGTRFSMETV